MNIAVGTDITTKKRFLQSLEKGGDAFVQKLFLPQELRQNSREQLASIFSLKEAVLKALQLPAGSWQSISTRRMGTGKVIVSVTNKALAATISSLDTSISHEGELIIAVAVFLIK